MSTVTDNPFAPHSRSNPSGFRTREVTLQLERAPAPGEPMVVAISSEAPVERYDWMMEGDGRYLEVLDHGPGGPDLSYCRDGLPFLLDHEIDDQIGLGTPPVIGPDKVLRTTVTQGNHPDAAWVFADMAAGIRKKVSIGYWPGDTYEQTVQPDGTVVRRYRGWTLYEASSVAVPADYSVGVGRSAGTAGAASAPTAKDNTGRIASGRAPVQQASPAAAAKAQNKERTMDDVASVPGSAPAPDTLKRDTRPAELAALARNFPQHARLEEWILDGTAVDAARDEVMRKLSAAAAAAAKPAASPAATVGEDREAAKPWASSAEFLRAVRGVAIGAGTDKRLVGERAASGAGVQIGADGGFLVPEQFAQGIVRYAFETGQILSRVNRIPVAGNQYHMNLVDESSRTTGNRFGGVRGYWVGEGDTITASKPRFRRATLDVTKKLTVAAYVSSEMLEDAPATSTIMDQAFGEEVAFLTEQAIFEGTGVGQPLGLLNSNALVSVAKESGQTAATVNATNVLKMRARLLARSRANAAFFVHLDVEPQLSLMTIGNQPVYLPPGGLTGNPLGQLLGIPVVPVEHCAALGTQGDIILADLSWYALGEKAQTTMARSMHVRFLNDEETFRLTYRVDGFPMLNQPITPNKGSSTLSAYVTLDTRA